MKKTYLWLQSIAARALPVVLTFAAVLPFVVYAQDAAPAPAVAPALPADLTDIGAIAKLAYDAIMNKQWGLLASVVLAAVIASLRKWVPESSKLGTWLRTKLGAIITNFALSLSSAFATMFLAGASFSADLVFKALSVALAASGGWAIWKNVSEAVAEGKAQKAGADAAETPPGPLNQ